MTPQNMQEANDYRIHMREFIRNHEKHFKLYGEKFDHNNCERCDIYVLQMKDFIKDLLDKKDEANDLALSKAEARGRLAGLEEGAKVAEQPITPSEEDYYHYQEYFRGCQERAEEISKEIRSRQRSSK